VAFGVLSFCLAKDTKGRRAQSLASLNLGISGYVILCTGHVHCDMVSSISALYPLHDSSIPPPVVTIKLYLQSLPNDPGVGGITPS
jgi:hypothetical protein